MIIVNKHKGRYTLTATSRVSFRKYAVIAAIYGDSENCNEQFSLLGHELVEFTDSFEKASKKAEELEGNDYDEVDVIDIKDCDVVIEPLYM